MTVAFMAATLWVSGFSICAAGMHYAAAGAQLSAFMCVCSYRQHGTIKNYERALIFYSRLWCNLMRASPCAFRDISCDVAFTAKWVVKSKALSPRTHQRETCIFIRDDVTLEWAPQKGYFIAGPFVYSVEISIVSELPSLFFWNSRPRQCTRGCCWKWRFCSVDVCDAKQKKWRFKVARNCFEGASLLLIIKGFWYSND